MSEAPRLAAEAQDSIALRGFVIAYLSVKLPWIAGSVVPRGAWPSGYPAWTAAWMAIGAAVVGVATVVVGMAIARPASARSSGHRMVAARLLALECRCVGALMLVSTLPTLVDPLRLGAVGGLTGTIIGALLLRARPALRFVGLEGDTDVEGAMESETTLTDRDVARVTAKLFGWLLISGGLLQAAGLLIQVPFWSTDAATKGGTPWLAAGGAAHPALSIGVGWILAARAAAIAVAVAPVERPLSVGLERASLRSIFRVALLVLGAWGVLDAAPAAARAVVWDVSPWRTAIAEPLATALTAPLTKLVLALGCIVGSTRIAARLYPLADAPELADPATGR